jgi:hypothetical protein
VIARDAMARLHSRGVDKRVTTRAEPTLHRILN